jgi:hypothetical protein
MPLSCDRLLLQLNISIIAWYQYRTAGMMVIDIDFCKSLLLFSSAKSPSKCCKIVAIASGLYGVDQVKGFCLVRGSITFDFLACC